MARDTEDSQVRTYINDKRREQTTTRRHHSQMGGRGDLMLGREARLTGQLTDALGRHTSQDSTLNFLDSNTQCKQPAHLYHYR